MSSSTNTGATSASRLSDLFSCRQMADEFMTVFQIAELLKLNHRTVRTAVAWALGGLAAVVGLAGCGGSANASHTAAAWTGTYDSRSSLVTESVAPGTAVPFEGAGSSGRAGALTN